MYKFWKKRSSEKNVKCFKILVGPGLLGEEDAFSYTTLCFYCCKISRRCFSDPSYNGETREGVGGFWNCPSRYDSYRKLYMVILAVLIDGHWMSTYIKVLKLVAILLLHSYQAHKTSVKLKVTNSEWNNSEQAYIFWSNALFANSHTIKPYKLG